LVIIVKKSLYEKNCRIVSSSLQLLNLFYRDTLFISFKNSVYALMVDENLGLRDNINDRKRFFKYGLPYSAILTVERGLGIIN